MIKQNFLVCLIACVSGLLPQLSSAQTPPTLSDSQGFTLVKSDSFDQLDLDSWCSRLPYGGGAPVGGTFSSDASNMTACTHRGQLDYLNDELQRYREGTVNGVQMHGVAGSVLTLGAVKTATNVYASGMVRSRFVFEPDAYTDYYVSAVTRAPFEEGTWPTFWLLPSTFEGRAVWPPELDINEAPNNRISSEPAQGDCVNGVNSVPGDGLIYQHGQRDTPPPNSLPCSKRHGWLQSGVLWTNDNACFTLDGQWDPRSISSSGGLLASVAPAELNLAGSRPITCQPYPWKNRNRDANAAAIIFNLAIGGTFGGIPTLDSYRYEVDKVEIFQKCRPDATRPTTVATMNSFGEAKLLNCAPSGGGGGVPCKGNSGKPAGCTPR